MTKSRTVISRSLSQNYTIVFDFLSGLMSLSRMVNQFGGQLLGLTKIKIQVIIA